MVDVIEMKAYLYDSEGEGTDYGNNPEVPSELMSEARDVRHKLIEALAELNKSYNGEIHRREKILLLLR